MIKCIFNYFKITQKYYYLGIVKILSVCYNISRGKYTQKSGVTKNFI